jgi:hypothetical protein
VTQDIWRSLPIEEQRRFLRHVRSYWDVHRHRAAPEIADLLDDMRNDGIVRLHTGGVTRYSESRHGAKVHYWDRETRAVKTLQVDRVINCSGSETDCRRIDESLITSLFAQGLARPDRLFLGVDVDAHGALIDHKGMPSRRLYAIGPARKGCFWEAVTPTTKAAHSRGICPLLNKNQKLAVQQTRKNKGLNTGAKKLSLLPKGRTMMAIVQTEKIIQPVNESALNLPESALR